MRSLCECIHYASNYDNYEPHSLECTLLLTKPVGSCAALQRHCRDLETEKLEDHRVRATRSGKSSPVSTSTPVHVCSHFCQNGSRTNELGTAIRDCPLEQLVVTSRYTIIYNIENWTWGEEGCRAERKASSATIQYTVQVHTFPKFLI